MASLEEVTKKIKAGLTGDESYIIGGSTCFYNAGAFVAKNDKHQFEIALLTLKDHEYLHCVVVYDGKIAFDPYTVQANLKSNYESSSIDGHKYTIKLKNQQTQEMNVSKVLSTKEIADLAATSKKTFKQHIQELTK